MTERMSAAHEAVELGDLDALEDLLAAGLDPEEEWHGLTLLMHAVLGEADAFDQTGEWDADATALLLKHGADPTRPTAHGTGITPEHVAWTHGHDLATRLFTAWRRERGLPEVAAPARPPTLHLTEAAITHIAAAIDGRPEPALAYRIMATHRQPSGVWFHGTLTTRRLPDDVSLPFGPVTVLVDKFSAPYLDGVTHDHDGAYRFSR